MSSIISSFVRSCRLLFKNNPKITVLPSSATNLINFEKIITISNKFKLLRCESTQKSWATSIIVHSETVKVRGVSDINGKKIKAPKLLSRKVNQSNGSINPPAQIQIKENQVCQIPLQRVQLNRRRRMSDNTWTKNPMDDKLIWIDCEMTGLDYNSEMIMEIGCIITGPNLEEIARQPSIIINVPEDKLNGLDAWCLKHHGDSGLIDACRKSNLSSEEVDVQLLNFVQKYTTKQECPMAGNSIYMDRIFISKQFPQFHSHFHYRNVDVSSIKELTRRWYPQEYARSPKKKFSHRVLDDILDSIAELQYYRATVFRDVNQDTNAQIQDAKMV